MTDTAFNPAPVDDVYSTIRAGRSSHPLFTATEHASPNPGLRSINVLTADDAHLTPDEERAYAEQAGATASVADCNNDLHALTTRAEWIDSRLAEFRYDSRTGAKVYAVDELTRQRLATERGSIDESMKLTLAIRDAATARQGQNEAREVADAETQSAELEWINSDPKRAEALRRAKLEVEARHMAEWAVARRYQTPAA